MSVSFQNIEGGRRSDCVCVCMCICVYITNLIVNDDQQDATILSYLFIPNQLYMFRAMSSPIVRSTSLYLQHLILSTGIAAGWCHR